MRKIKRDIVAALIFSKDGKLFQGKKDPKQGGVYSDCWHIPGGGIREGENKREALIREVREETGLDITLYDIELVDSEGRGSSEKVLADGEVVICEMKFYVYKISVADKNTQDIEISLDDDLVEYRWTKISELKSLKLTPPSVELFTKLGYLNKKH